MKHVVMFSSGAGSWAAADWVVRNHGTEGLYLVFSDVNGEDEDNYRFLREAAAELGGELVWLKDGRTIWDVFREDRFLGNSRLANCSKYLKQIPAKDWLRENCDPSETVVYIGIDWTETHRLPAIRHGYSPYTVTAPLTEPPYLTKEQVLHQLKLRGIRPPRLYGMGFAHANCGGGCVRAGQGQFVRLLEVMPERYAEWEENEQAIRDHLGKDVSILRDRRGGKSRPLTLRDLRARHQESPEEIDQFDIGGCGCFTEGEGVDEPDPGAPGDPDQAS